MTDKLKQKLSQAFQPKKSFPKEAILAVLILVLLLAVLLKDTLTIDGDHAVIGDGNKVTIVQPQKNHLLKWTDYTPSERDKIRAEIFILFPAVFDLKDRQKWVGVKEYLRKKYGADIQSVRDILRTSHKNKNWPALYNTAILKKNLIKTTIVSLDEKIFRYYWKGLDPHSFTKENRYTTWILQIRPHIIDAVGETEAEKILNGLQ